MNKQITMIVGMVVMAVLGEAAYVIPVVVHEEVVKKESVGTSDPFAPQRSIPVIDGSVQEQERLEKARLEWVVEQEFVFQRTSLGLVVQALAEAATMNYVAPSGEMFEQEITLRVRTNPYRMLELLARQHGYTMHYRLGTWEFFEEEHQQLISRTYLLRFSDGGAIEIRPPSVSGAIRSNTGAGPRSQDGVFDGGGERIVEDVRRLLELPLSGDREESLDALPRKKQANATPLMGGQVFYVAETSSLLVIASHAHHRMVEQYLQAVDQRQRLVKIQALIIESSNPEKMSVGVDWSAASGVRFGVGQLSRDFQQSWSRNRAYTSLDGKDAGDLSSAAEWASSRADTALLSAGDFSWTLNFIRTDGESRVVNDPVAVTLNRRPVRFETVTELPVQTGSSSTTSTVASSSVQQTEYIEIGFFLDVIPQIIPGGMYGWDEEAVRLDVSIVVSNQVGEQKIGDRPYPITARRTYAYSVVVPSGYTLAIGGLREEGEKEVNSSVPLLGDLPLLGFLFRSTEKEKIQRNLIAYITPTILNQNSPEFSSNQREEK